ncbi:MAG: coproporphyrinogen dehydrogenase HemZ [Firmicutes bacterium]|nr:coproporphyrinogen dehydrogenase HemZ [Bacillota bacterium]
MYTITITNQFPANEIEELIKMFVPKGEYELNVEEALANAQSFSVVFDGERISRPVSDYDPPERLFEEKKELKNAVKRGIYTALSTHTGKTLPWGTLTGVKPGKIVRDLKDRGWKEAEIRTHMKEYYYLSPEKTELLMEILHNQYPFAKPEGEKSAGIYLGIPFCPTRCVYCSFTSNIPRKDDVERYLAALYREIEYVGSEMQRTGWKADSFYIGGGTPTTLEEDQLEDLLTAIFREFDLSGCREFTVEAGRPDTITLEKMQVIKSFGIDRISINPQSMKQRTLDLIGRSHTPEEILTAFETARKAGIGTINMDLIAGLPEESPEDLMDTLEQVTALGPENITIHTLALKRASRLKMEDEEYHLKHGDVLTDMVAKSQAYMKQAGYEPYYLYRQKYMAGNYENVGYCLPGKECLYNIRTMDEQQTMIALGAGGISKRYFSAETRIERSANVSNFEIYIDRIDEMLNRKYQLLFA